MKNWSRENFEQNGLMQGDVWLWVVLFSLCCVSVVTVYSASSRMTYGTGLYWMPVVKHMVFLMGGIFISWVLHMLPCKLYKLLGLLLSFFSYIALFVAHLTGQINGAARWAGIGGFKFQPSEFAKLGLVMTTALFFSVFRDKNGVSKTGTWLAAINAGLTTLLIVTENLSTAAIIVAVMIGMAFIAQVSNKYLSILVGGLFAVALGGYLAMISIPQSTLDDWAKSDGILHRVPTWVNRITKDNKLPENPNDYNIIDNVQVTHAQIAVATCGLHPRGPGKSVERDYLPHADSDFIFAIIIEEWSILMGMLVMSLYLLMLYRAYRIAKRCKSLFPAYLIMGLALMVVTQAMINMAVAVGAMPVTGQTLPLISRGGTSVFTNCAIIGIMLSVSRSAKRVEENKNKTESNTESCNNPE